MGQGWGGRYGRMALCAQPGLCLPAVLCLAPAAPTGEHLPLFCPTLLPPGERTPTFFTTDSPGPSPGPGAQ